MLMRGVGVSKDEARAMVVLKKGCEGGDPRACGDLGLLMMPTDARGAAQVFRRGCMGGDPVSCLESGRGLETGSGGMGKNEMLAGMMYQIGCNGLLSRGYGSPEVCTGAGRMEQAQGGQSTMARVYLERACMSREPLACAILKATGMGQFPVMLDIPQQTRWQQACVRGDGLACGSLGIVEIANGMTNGKSDLDQGCRMMNKWSCEIKKLVH